MALVGLRVLPGNSGPVADAVSEVPEEGPPISETWSGPLGSHGATGTFITNVESFDGNVWTIIGPAGLNTGQATFSGDLNLEDPVPSLSGGEPTIVVTNLGVSYSNVVVRTTIQHNSVNGGAIAVRTFMSPESSGGYYFVVEGSTGAIFIKIIITLGVEPLGGIEVLAVGSIPSYDPSLTYELAFSVIGNRLSGVVRLENEEVASVFALDDTFTTGNVGLFGTTALPESPFFPLSDQPLNVTFGDFFAYPLPPIGGTTELLVGGSDSPGSASDGSGPSAPLYAAIAGAAAAAALAAVAAGGWYATRRFRQRRI